MANVQNLLRGKPVFIMRVGHFPNHSDIVSAINAHPDTIVRTELMYTPEPRFAVTVAPKRNAPCEAPTLVIDDVPF